MNRKRFFIAFLAFFDGRNYTQIRDLGVRVVGYVRYSGPVMDAPPFHLEVEAVQPKTETR